MPAWWNPLSPGPNRVKNRLQEKFPDKLCFFVCLYICRFVTVTGKTAEVVRNASGVPLEDQITDQIADLNYDGTKMAALFREKRICKREKSSAFHLAFYFYRGKTCFWRIHKNKTEERRSAVY